MSVSVYVFVLHVRIHTCKNAGMHIRIFAHETHDTYMYEFSVSGEGSMRARGRV